MTDNEIIKALELDKETIVALGGLNGIPPIVQHTDVIDLINRQKAEIERLQSVNADMQESLRLAAEANKDMQAEVERYKTYYETMETEIYSFRKDQAEVKFLKNKIRAEAIKEFAERAKGKAHFSEDFGEAAVSCHDINALVKEMTEEKK